VSWCYTRYCRYVFFFVDLRVTVGHWLPEHFHYALVNCLYYMIILRLILINIPAIGLVHGQPTYTARFSLSDWCWPPTQRAVALSRVGNITKKSGVSLAV